MTWRRESHRALGVPRPERFIAGPGRMRLHWNFVKCGEKGAWSRERKWMMFLLSRSFLRSLFPLIFSLILTFCLFLSLFIHSNPLFFLSSFHSFILFTLHLYFFLSFLSFLSFFYLFLSDFFLSFLCFFPFVLKLQKNDFSFQTNCKLLFAFNPFQSSFMGNNSLNIAFDWTPTFFLPSNCIISNSLLGVKVPCYIDPG